jgi:hypothetical protein
MKDEAASEPQGALCLGHARQGCSGWLHIGLFVDKENHDRNLQNSMCCSKSTKQNLHVMKNVHMHDTYHCRDARPNPR